jgi:multiple sugar transport system permease protein
MKNQIVFITKKRRKIIANLLTYGFLIIISIITIFPLYWVLSTSFRPAVGQMGTGFAWFPHDPTLDNYKTLISLSKVGFGGAAFVDYIRNSTIVSLSTTFVSIVIGTLAAYSLSRFDYKGKVGLLILFIITQLITTIALILPLYRVFRLLGLIDTRFALVLTYTSFAVPFCTWFLKGFFDSIPIELDEAALIDGASRLQALFHVIIPVSIPGIVATGVFAFIVSWNEFMFALTFINSASIKTIPLGIAELLGEHFVPWGVVTAGGVLASIPVMLFFIFFQQYIVQGLTSGAVKG